VENADERPRVKVEGSTLRCPFCHEGCAPEESVVCRDCLARHHGPCWDEGGRCSSCGSINKLVAAEPPVDGPRTLPSVASGAPRSLPVHETPSYEGSGALRFQAIILFAATLLALFAPALSVTISGITLFAILVLSMFSKSRLVGFTIAFNMAALIFGVCAGAFSLEARSVMGPPVLALYTLLIAWISWWWGCSSR
jgi:hypothetical protein